VVRDEKVGREVLAHGGRVLLDEAAPLLPREILQVPSFEILVTVEHEHGQRTALEVGTDDARAPEVVQLRVRLLAEHHDLVAEPAPRPRERPRVDVRPRAAQEVAVPKENPHRRNGS
jgi:hypothetical protein